MRTLLLAALLLLAPSTVRAQVSALVVGHGSPERVAQATAVAEALRASAPGGTVRLLTGAEATSASVRAALFQLLARQSPDVLVYAAADVALQRYPSGAETGWLMLEGSRPSALPRDVPERALALQPVVDQLAGASARRIVLAFDTDAAGLAVPGVTARPDTFLALVAGPSAPALPLGRALSSAGSYADGLAQLLRVEDAVRLSLQPARSIARTLRPVPASATLALPPLPAGMTVDVDGQETSGGALPVEPGDHTLVVALNGLPLWRAGVVLASRETRRLQTALELREPVRIVRSARLSGGLLRINGAALPGRDTVSVAPGRLWAEVALPGGATLSGEAFAQTGQQVYLSQDRRFDVGRFAVGALVPGLNQLRDRRPAKAAVVVGALAGAGAFAALGNRSHQTRLAALAEAQQAYNRASSEAGTDAARQGLAAAYAEAQASHRRQQWGVGAVAAALALNLVDVWLHHGRSPFLRLTVSPLPR